MKRQIKTPLSFIFLLSPLLAMQCAQAALYALVVGNSQYENLRILKNPKHDAERIAGHMQDFGYQLIGGGVLYDVSAEQLLDRLNELKAQLHKDDTVFIYYAGHGLSIPGKGAFVLPVDSKKRTDLLPDSLRLDKIIQSVTAKAKLTVAVFDACREIKNIEQSWRGEGYSEIRSMAQAQVITGKGDSIIAFSAQYGHYAADGTGKHSPYNEVLEQYITQPYEIGDLFRQVAADLGRTTGQRPEVLTGAAPDTYYFSRPIKTYSLSVKTSPEQAKVRLLNIEQDYQNGMRLKPGRYHIEVTATGYQLHTEWLELSANGVHSVVLKKIETPSSTPIASDLDHNLQTPKPFHTITDTTLGMNMQMIWLPPTGEQGFMMGSPETEDDRDNDEPQHKVILTQGFYIGKYEVTQAQWRAVMGKDPKALYFKNCGNDCPVESVSWGDVQQFIKKLNEKTNHRYGYRLLTEAEWEYACRSGQQQRYCGGESVDQLAWYDDNSGAKTHPVGQKSKNHWGLYDMSGNVYEWVSDRYAKDYGGYTANKATVDPKGPLGGANRVYRGGSWRNYARRVRSAFRGYYSPGYRNSNVGFRLARTY